MRNFEKYSNLEKGNCVYYLNKLAELGLIDTELSETSINPILNLVITNKIRQIESNINSISDITQKNTNSIGDAVLYTTFNTVAYNDKMQLSFRSIDDKVKNVDFPAATINTAGVMSAEDKAKLKQVIEQQTSVSQSQTALQLQVNNIKPIEIKDSNIVNAPDEEDITMVGNVLKLKDRIAGNGMGYVILRKNKTFIEQVTKANTIYEIRYDFDLNGGTVEIPENCILKFDGGKLSNGNLQFQSTTLDGDVAIACNVRGDITNRTITLSNFSFTNDDQIYKFLNDQRWDNLTVVFESKEYVFSENYAYGNNAAITITGASNIKIIGNNSVLKALELKNTTGTLGGFIRLIDCTNIDIYGFTFISVYNPDVDESERASDSTCFVNAQKTVRNLSLNADIRNASSILAYTYWDLLANPVDMGEGVVDSIITGSAENYRYGALIKQGHNLKIVLYTNYGSRSAYLSACDGVDITIYNRGKVSTGTTLLLTDQDVCRGSVEDIRWLGCKNINAKIEDDYTDIYRHIVFLQFYEDYHYLNRTVSEIWENIHIDLIVNDSNALSTSSLIKTDYAVRDGADFAPIWGSDEVKDKVINLSLNAYIKGSTNKGWGIVKTSNICLLNSNFNVELTDSGRVDLVLFCSSDDDYSISTNKDIFCSFHNNEGLDMASYKTPILNIKKANGVRYEKIEEGADTPELLVANGIVLQASTLKHMKLRGIPPCLENPNGQNYQSNIGDGVLNYDASFSLILVYNKGKVYTADGWPYRGRRKGSTENRPNIMAYTVGTLNANSFAGAPYYDVTIKRPIYWDSFRQVWRDAHGRAALSLSGTERPTGLNKVEDVGYQYFDTALNKPIWWNGSEWVDSTGATV